MTDIDKLVAELTLDEKCSLTAGQDFWSTVPVERLGIPSVKVTDGPNGARGPIVPGEGTLTAACVPCGSALGATWDPALIEEVGALVGEEARSKTCRVLLAPTVNIHRSPLAGRNFECYSEDPLLSGRAAAAFVRGVQSQAVGVTVKHFAGNDAETERNTVNSVIDERALREIYLVPFELAVTEGGALGVMTGYNRLNGPWCAEHEDLLARTLRGQWGFEGFVISDWLAVGSTDGSARAGLDLEMPGPGRIYGAHLARAVRDGTVAEEEVDAIARRLLTVFDRVGAFDDDPDAQPRSIDRPEHRAVARRAAAASTVLLTNNGILPLDVRQVSSVAVIGPNADRAQIMGGGSANFRPHYRISPLEAIRSRLGAGIGIRHERGCDIDRTAQPLSGRTVVAADGTPGFDAELFAGTAADGEPVHRMHLADSRLLFFPNAPVVGSAPFAVRASGRWAPEESGRYTLSLVQAGRARLLVDGAVVLDGTAAPPPPGTEMFGMASQEMTSTIDVDAGRTYQIVIEYSSEGAFLARGVTVGLRRPTGGLLEPAVEAAKQADVAVVIVGTNADWESEGHDRSSLQLPGEQDELIRRVAEVNPNTVVVVNTGAPVTMEWADRVAAVLQVWFGGQEMANALVDVLTGEADPGGRLPTTFPQRVEHNPSFGNFPGENGTVRYGESVLVGYRWYEARRLPVLWPFGHGLSYTSFEIGPPELSSTELREGDVLRVRVPVTNTGPRAGAEVVQCYVGQVAPTFVRPPKELRAFAKVHLQPGETTTVDLELGPRAFAFWDPGHPDMAEMEARLAAFRPFVNLPPHRSAPGWRIDPGSYDVAIGRSSADIAHVATVMVAGGG